MNLDLQHVRKIETENGTLKRRVEELEHDVKMLRTLIEGRSSPDVPIISVAKFTPAQKTILTLLWQRRPQPVCRYALSDALYQLDPQERDRKAAAKIVDVFVCRIRKLLNGTGFSIKTHWGKGYSLELSS